MQRIVRSLTAQTPQLAMITALGQLNEKARTRYLDRMFWLSSLLLVPAVIDLQDQPSGKTYTLLPPERWKGPELAQFRLYPFMAGRAGIQGDVRMSVLVEEGKPVQRVKLLSGPAQLHATAASLAESLMFDLGREDGKGPWVVFVTATFTLNTKSIRLVATPREQIPSPAAVPTQATDH